MKTSAKASGGAVFAERLPRRHVSYYRDRLHLSWLPTFTRQGPDGDYDYYILTERDQDRIQRYHLHVIYRGPVSRTVLARKS